MRAFTDEKKERAVRIRRRIALIMALIAAAVAVAQFFLPFVTFRLDKVGYTFSSLQVVTSFLTVEGVKVTMPLAAKIVLLLTPALAVVGAALLLCKKPVASAILYMLAALAPIGGLIALNAATSHFVDIGVSRVEVAYHTALALALLSSLLAAVCAMWTRGGEKLAEAVFLVFACMSVGSVILITVYMLTSGAPAIAEVGLFQFLFGTEWNPNKDIYGIGYMLLASVAGMAGAILIGVPIGLLTAIFLAELAPRRLAGVVRPAVELLAGIPSVIYGFFGLIVLVPFIRRVFPSSFGDSLLAMILILAIMVLPTIISVSETALRSVPASYKEASLALGNTHIGTIFKVLVPAAKSGILAGVILGVGRAVGETMAVVMVCGNKVQFPQLLKSVRPLTSGVVLEMSYAYGLHRQALFSIGLVLFVFIMIVNISFTMLSKRGVQISGKE